MTERTKDKIDSCFPMAMAGLSAAGLIGMASMWLGIGIMIAVPVACVLYVLAE